MTVATVRTVHLSETLQTLIDSRLDTIERMLMGRVARAERLAIVREVESQIHELLQERNTDELSREEVLAVLARLDPPEAFLPEDSGSQPLAARPSSARQLAQPARQGNRSVARASGVLGLTALASNLLFTLYYPLAVALNSEVVLIALYAGTILAIFTCSVVGLVLGAYARGSGMWALVGIVTSILALLLLLVIIIVIAIFIF